LKNREGQRGVALLEVALIVVFVLVPLMLCIIEGGKVITEYATLNEASRVAARRVVVSGQTSDVVLLVRSVAGDLDPGKLQTNVITDHENGFVRVEVTYEHEWLLGKLAENSGLEDFTYTASTTMPLP
jgi:Flp pilus assembly protein TadG